MENQNNNNLSELDQLKAQYETLKERFEQQEIINDRLLKSSIKSSTDYYTRFRRRQLILYPLFVVIGLLFIKWYQDANLSLMLFWITWLSVCFVVELWTTKRIQSKALENNDLLTLSNQARSFKKLSSVYIVQYPIPALILILGFLLSVMGYGLNAGSLIILIGAVFALFVGVAIAEYRYKTKHCDDIIRQIEASAPDTVKKTKLDKKQKWFIAAMIIVFLSLDIWAYMITASFLNLPRPWFGTRVEYVRTPDNFSTENKLEIWETEADTVAISSAMMGEKPLVQKVEVFRPHIYTGSDSLYLIVHLTPEASKLWYQFTSAAAGHHAALYLDGVQIQDWLVKCGIENGTFFIMKEWSSKEEQEKFCERLIRQ